MQRDSVIYKILRNVDTFWYHLDGYLPDYERMPWIYSKRPLFTKDGLIKADLSLIPFRDRRLAKLSDEYGGWKAITSAKFEPPEHLYIELADLGIGRAAFELSRRYWADPREYRANALEKHDWENIT